MNLSRKAAAVAVAALALTALPSGAQAHDGSHPFKNCPEAYKNGYANISKGDEHYGAHLDRDKDGVGCDSPPSGFVPAEDDAKDSSSDDSSQDDSSQDDSSKESSSKDGSSKDDTELAETGGNDTTPYLAGGGAAVLLAGGGLLIVARRRRASR